MRNVAYFMKIKYELAKFCIFLFQEYQRRLTSMVYKFSNIKIGSRVRVTNKIGVNVNEVLAQELRNLVIKKFKRKKVCVKFKDNIWAADLAEM